MRKIIYISTLCLFLISSASWAYEYPADPYWTVELAGAWGSGCPHPNEVRVVPTPDYKTIVARFDDYHANTDTSPVGVDLARCNITIWVWGYPDYQFSWVGMRYRGFLYMDEGSKTLLEADYYFNDTPVHQHFKREWNPDYPIAETMYIEDKFFPPSYKWSECGEGALVTLDSALTAFKHNGNFAQIMLTHNDITTEVYFQLDWRPCTPQAE
ncbi:DUF4360 domain-containing protein [Hahella sp. HN01]|uniref:DUF4360 domain-containing protein n=1 Tax=Hahella sp. HN01 TaxID=2847262 RepID=UPI001C1EF404|nr:DUF4360 domain-containing protein [Hahella sp. HN01]MBU6953186.1 DUF4360 domain-containing protein [Hahella sp. HN01]